MQIDTEKWSGEGAFTQVLIDQLKSMDRVAFLRVEDAPASRSEADYNFISNEIFVGFETVVRKERVRRFGVLSTSRDVVEKTMTLEALERALGAISGVGEPDYSDPSMMQYLRAERVVPPYQTRGYKLVELVRIYEVGADGAKPTPLI
ncbi:MAG TPA: hypothetical protein VGJ29_17245 [Vicinamibacterales bacterium]|jgi:hypothetical protein